MKKILILLILLLSIPNLVKAGGPTPDYLTFTSNQDGSEIGFAKIAEGATIQYYDGTGWVDASNLVNNPLTLNKGQSVQFKGDYSTASVDCYNNFTKFTITGDVSASGDINTLINGQGGDITLPDYAYYSLFKSCTGLTDASKLKLPSTTLAEGCYRSMFAECSNLTTAPDLPATTLAKYCYSSMFAFCTKIKEIKVHFTEWSPTGATQSWVEGMASTGTFYCPSGLEEKNGISKIPNGWTVKHPEYLTFTANENSTIGFTQIANGANMQYNTGSDWKDASELKTTPLTLNKGQSVKFKCVVSALSVSNYTQFTITGDVSASGDINTLIDGIGGDITLPDFAYYFMFGNCSGLTDASGLMLPSTILSKYCCGIMFKSCQNLTTAPKLLATTLDENSYGNMFVNCTKLNKIEVNFTDWNTSQNSTLHWLQGVASTGTFICPEGLVVKNDDTHIPKGWVVPDYLTFTSNEDGSEIGFTGIAGGAKIEYNVGDGWKDASELKTTPLTLNSGKSVKFKGDYSNATIYTTSSTWFEISGNVSVSGDINTLIDGVGGDIELKDYIYYHLFIDCTGLTDASNLKLPSKNLKPYSYASMFQGCTGLISAPKELPATNLAKYCYERMFDGCIKLTTAPKELPATTLADREGCYSYMFNGCTSLTTAPELKATTLASSCYKNMFQGCTGLTSAPELKAIQMRNNCYQNMFEGCTSLTTAPELPATTLAYYCYNGMFKGCTILNKISVKFIDWNTSNKSTENWVDGVASTGTFICPEGLAENYGQSNIPNGWTVKHPEYLTFTANEHSTIGFNKIANGAKIQYNIGDGWVDATASTSITLNKDKSVKFRGDYSNATTSGTIFTQFTFTGVVSASGDINTLIDGVGGDILLPDYAYYALFRDCKFLTDASQLKLLSTTLAEGCYNEMFSGCSGLTTAPELPATNLADYCYSSMFYGCTKLTTAPELPATTLKKDCYGAMFKGCSSLNKIEVNFTDWNNEESTSNWVYNVAGTGTFICPKGLEKNYGESYIPNGWKSVTPDYLTFTANDASEIRFAKLYDNVKLEYNLDDGNGWQLVNVNTNISLAKGDVVKFRGNNPNGLNNQNGHNLSSDTQFKITGDVSASGDINSLMNNYGGDIQLRDNNYCGLFQGCLGLTDVSNLILSSKSGSLSYNCYASMFEGCSNIFSTPEISAINGSGGASNMFKDCSSLFMIKVDNCLDAFKNDFAINWLSGVAETGVFNCKEIDQVSDIKRGVNYIPEGWYVNPLFIVLNEDNIDDGLSLSESKYYTEDFGKLCDEFFSKTQGMKAEDIYSMDEEIKVKYDNYRIDNIVEDSNHPKVQGSQLNVIYDETEFTFKVSYLKYSLSKITIIGTPLYQVKYYSKDIELCVEKDQNTPIKFDKTSKLSDLKSSSIENYQPELYTDAECTKQLGENELLKSYCSKGEVKLYKKPIEYTITLGENVTCSTTKATIETPAISFSLANREDEQLKIKSVFINSTDVTSSIKDYEGSFKMSDYLTDVTIKAEYELKGFDIILKSDDIYNLSATSAFEGDEVTFSVKSKEYQVPVVMINGEEISSDNLDYKYIMGNKLAEISVVYSEIKIEELSLENSQETACAGNKLTVNISVTDNAKYYSIIFADELINQGFENVDFIELTSSKVTLTIPTTAVSGEYEASFVAKSKNGVVSKPQALKFKVAYPTDIIKIKFGDVICIDNSSKQFVGYQWIKDGKEIPGATEQFYCETPKLTGVYSIKLTKVDGSIIETCSLKMSEGGASKSFSKNINVYPNPSKYGDPIYIDLADYNELEISKSRIEIYDLKGGLILKDNNLSPINQITLPKGFYNGALILDGRKYSFKVVVK